MALNHGENGPGYFVEEVYRRFWKEDRQRMVDLNRQCKARHCGCGRTLTEGTEAPCTDCRRAGSGR